MCVCQKFEGVWCSLQNCRPPNVLIHSLQSPTPLFGRRLPFLFHLIPFQKYPSLIKNRRNRTATKTILFCPLPFYSLISKIYISFFGCLRKPFFLISISHTIFGLFPKRRPPTLFREKLLLTPKLLLPVPLLTFSSSSPHTICILLHISRNSKLFSSVKRAAIFVG